MEISERPLRVSGRIGDVTSSLCRATAARWLMVLGHGAGAGMRHPFMEAMARRLADREIATFRYQFPYVEQGRRRPDPPPVLVATVRAAVAAAGEAAGDLALLAGGKSLGGRMTSTAFADDPLPGVRGLVFLGFPLHAPGEPSTERSRHLERVRVPMLFVQGTRDRLARSELIQSVCDKLGRRATLEWIDGGDHSFHVPKRSGRTDEEAWDDIGDRIRDWAERWR